MTENEQVVAAFSRLSAAVVADVFRYAGFRQQVMDPTILPLDTHWKLCGRAFTQANLPLRKDEASVGDQAEMAMKPGDVVVESYGGAWGLNYAVAARARGVVGAVIDGPHRDIPSHLQLLSDLPVFCRRGLSERSSNPGGSHRAFRTRWMYAYNVPINCGGVRVEAGDVLLGDADGVVVVPRAIESQILEFAQGLAAAEEEVFEAKRNLESHSKAQEAIRSWLRDSQVEAWGSTASVR